MPGNKQPLIQPAEWFWVIACTIVILVTISLPFLYGMMLSTPANQFGGFVIGLEDGNSYLAKMQEGRAGHWLFYLAYTPEPHQGALFFFFYLLSGKLAALFQLEALAVFQWSKLFTVSFGLFSFYYFAAYFTPHIFTRRLAFLLFGTSAGLGWLWLLLGFPAGLGHMPVDLWVPDASFFLSAFTFTHLPLAQGLLLWVVIATLNFLERGRWQAWLVAAGAGLLVSLIHPYKLVILNTILGAFLLWQMYWRKEILWSKLGRLALVSLPALPYMIYVLTVFETNFAFKGWRDQSLTWSPQPIHYLLGFGLILPLVGLGMWQSLRRPVENRTGLLIIWVLIVPLLLYVPIPLQRRFLDGYQAALAVLGAPGLAWLLRRIKRENLRRAVGLTIFLLMILTNLFLVVGAMVTINHQAPPVFHAGAQQAAIEWLAEHGPGQVIIAAYETGNILPAYAPVRVFVGHGPETFGSDEKRAILAQFFKVGNDAFRNQLLQDYGISYLFYGPREQALGDFSPAESSNFKQVYDNGPVQIYEVIHPVEISHQ